MLAMACSSIGKFTIAMNFALLYLYTGELYPTSCRSVGFTICSGFARLSTIGLPYIIDGKWLHSQYFDCFLAGRELKWLPSIIFSGFAIVSCVVSLTLPDTSNIKLLTTISEAEDFYAQATSTCFSSLSEKMKL